MDPDAAREVELQKLRQNVNFKEVTLNARPQFAPPWMQPCSVDLYAFSRKDQPLVARGLQVKQLDSVINAFNRFPADHQGEHTFEDMSTAFNLM
jgi:hypothetical protein